MWLKWLFVCSSGGERNKKIERERAKKAKAIICTVYMYTKQHEKSSCCFYILRLSLIICLRFILDDIDFVSNMIKINSPSSHSNSNKRLRFPIPRNRNNNLLINSTSKKFDNRKIHNHQQEKNSIDCNKTMKQEIIVANNNENDTTLLTTTTTVEFKVRTTKTSSRKRKSNVINDINNDNITKQQPLSKKKVIYKTTFETQKIERKFNLYFSFFFLFFTYAASPRG